jgi:serine/threonine protein kinase
MDKDYQTEVPDPTDENIRKIGNYTFNRRICIGQGSFGKVFKGADLLTGQKVAIKRIELRGFEHDTHFVSKILKEVRIMRQLNGHPNIVRLLDFIKGKAYYYLILELC